MGIINKYKTFLPKAAECTFFSSAHGTCSEIDHILGHKTNLSNFKKTEIIQSLFFNHSGMRFEMKNKNKNGKNTNTCRLNSMLQDSNWAIKNSMEESKCI